MPFPRSVTYQSFHCKPILHQQSLLSLLPSPLSPTQACEKASAGYLYLGAGNEHAKLGISIGDLIAVTKATVADISDTRAIEENGNIEDS